MEPSLETRLSLIVRLKDRDDQAAWQEFVEIYRPVILRLAARRGMQHADAEDLAQQVLVSISKAIGRWEIAPKRARFRTWLHRVAENAILNALSRGAPDRARGEAGHPAVEHAAEDGPDSDLLRLEYRREVFRWAARQIRPEFQPATWKAFWLSAVEDRAPEEVARLLHKSVGAVYAARSRIMRRLHEKVAEAAAEEEDR
jgi:RNA polymerase sigma factor (sigma-70 family)